MDYSQEKSHQSNDWEFITRGSKSTVFKSRDHATCEQMYGPEWQLDPKTENLADCTISGAFFHAFSSEKYPQKLVPEMVMV